jgi:putative ATP-binding cassette transporter
MTAFDFLKFINSYTGKQRNLVFISSAINGLCIITLMYSLQIGVVQVQKGGPVLLHGLLLFVLSLVVYYLTQMYAIRTSSIAAYTAIEDMELRLINKLRRIDYDAFKTISAGDIYAAVGGDKNSVVNAARYIVISLSGAVTVVLAVGYMATISLTGVLVIIIEYVLVIYIYKVQSGTLAKRAQVDFEATSGFTLSLEDIVNGFAELKMNNLKSEALYQKKIKTASDRKTDSLKETEIHWVNMLVLQQASIFIPMGLIVFIAPILSSINAGDITKILLITLIILTPAGTLALFVSSADMANNTLSKILNIEKQLDTISSQEEDGELSESPNPPAFDTIRIDSLVYTYPENNGRDGFMLRVKNFVLKKGEMLIIKGGNGSGKSTFMRLLAGLLRPVDGDIYLNDTAVSTIKSADYRGMFSIIFSDFHLFDDFYGIDIDKNALQYWIKKLRLTEPLKNFEKTGALPVKALSSGQRKRAALLAAIMEKRQILLLDEVAADFDPEFRSLYYRDILPELKSAGYTLVLVSHDDRYFDIADKIIEFNEGENIQNV